MIFIAGQKREITCEQINIPLVLFIYIESSVRRRSKILLDWAILISVMDVNSWPQFSGDITSKCMIIYSSRNDTYVLAIFIRTGKCKVNLERLNSVEPKNGD